jgi:RNA polymerase sigma-70 factor (ECF subfamily)
MNDTERAALEQEIRDRHARGDHEGAAEAAMRGYGTEVWNFLVALHQRDEDGAADAFSLFGEGLWRSLPRFQWHCSFRTWAYAIARRSSLRQRRDARRRAARHGTLPEGSALSRLVAEIPRTSTGSGPAARRSRLLELREALPAEDQTLLMLRVDRELAWNDLAHVLADGAAAPLQGRALERAAPRLRKRFQVVKEKLYDAARREGLVTPPPALE